MDLVSSIADYSTAKSMAELRSAIAVKVFKMAQAQDQVAADLLTEALDTARQTFEASAGDSADSLDLYA